MSSNESPTPENIGSTRQAMSDIVSNLADHDNNLEDIPSSTPGESDELDAEVSEMSEIEERSISNRGKKELLSQMLCKPSTLRTAHHLISTLGEQQQALEMMESKHVNLIPDGTARQGGWGKMAGAVMKIGEKYRPLRLQTLGSETHASWVETLVHMLRKSQSFGRVLWCWCRTCAKST